MKVWAHTLVKNEDRFLWYAVTSVADFVEKIVLWDTGSTDRTLEVIEALKRKYTSKIIFKQASGEFNEEDVRQKMLGDSDCDWILMLDGDEVWWEDSIKKMISTVEESDGLESVVVPTVNAIGDIFHYQEEAAGKYRFGSKIGHFALRLISTKINGLNSQGAHGVWGWADGDGKMIQDREERKIHFVDSPYLHLTHLNRSSLKASLWATTKRRMKLKHELGISFPSDFFYPEVFFRERPGIVTSPWKIMGAGYKFRAFFETPLRKIKRRLFASKVGY